VAATASTTPQKQIGYLHVNIHLVVLAVYSPSSRKKYGM
jgi:hypothetical protein